MTKKIFIVSAIIFLIAIIALVVSKVFLFKDGSSKLSIENVFFDEEDSNGDDGNETQMSNAKIYKVLERDVKGVVSYGANQVMFYDDQKFLSAKYDGKVKSSLGAYPFVRALEIKWHPEKEKALVNDNGTYYLYVLKDNSASEFPVKADVATWDVFGDRVIYKRYDADKSKRVIEVSKPSGEEREVLVDDLPFKNIDFTVPKKGGNFCYFPSPEGAVEGKLVCVDVKTAQQQEIHTGFFGVDYLISPNGRKVLLSYTQAKNADKLILGVMSSKGAEFQGLNFSTSVKKCVWANDNKHVFCGAINSIPKQAVLPNDWESKKYFSSDTFWKIDTESGKQTRLIDLKETPGHLDGTQFLLDEKEENLFFVERKSGNLYRINL